MGERIGLPAGGSAELVARYAGVRLLVARLHLPAPLHAYLAEHGRPIRYGYVPASWPLDAYQTVYALEPGSAEMPSAGRPFTAELITQLVAQGVLVAPVTLHTGVSSPERHERPYPERFRVPAHTARLVNAVHLWGGRVIATGTTVVRALETVAQPDGTVDAGDGWTNLVVTPERGLWTVDGAAHRPARVGVVAPGDAAGGRGRRPRRAQLPRGARARLPVARVRGQPPDPGAAALVDQLARHRRDREPPHQQPEEGEEGDAGDVAPALPAERGVPHELDAVVKRVEVREKLRPAPGALRSGRTCRRRGRAASAPR